MASLNPELTIEPVKSNELTPNLNTTNIINENVCL